MIYKELGKTGEKIPAIGLGTWGIGGLENADRTNDSQLIKTIEKAIGIGYKLIDTAEYYASGHTEELVGEAIKNFNRDKLFIVTKVWPNHLSKIELPKALSGSLKRLNLDYVDLYLIHWPSSEIPLNETLEVMMEVKSKGLIKHVGVSNFDTSLLEKAIEISDYQVVNNQVLFNMEHREPERELLPYCIEQGITLTAYSPLERTNLSSETRRKLTVVANNHNSSIYQLMLAWLLNKERVLTIPKSTNINHLRENLKAADIKLSSDELRFLSKN
ncbi:MAG: aldo/keto reductase [Kosmotogaceae bacterium]